jgi:glycosyltransferase involved in cell wall biosynthesis
MKILIYSGNTWNGIWSHSHELAKQLAKHVKTIYFSVPACQDPEHPNLNKKADYPISKGLNVVSSNISFENFSWPYFIYTQMYTIINFFKARSDVYFLYNVFDIPFFLLAKLFGKKVYFMYVDDYVALARSKFFKTLASIGTWLFFMLSDGIFCTARVLEETAREYNKKVYYTPNSVNIEDVKHLSKKTRKEFIIGFVGTLGHWVRVDQILAVARAFKKEKDTKILVVGGGEGLKALQQAKEKEKLDNMELIGFVPHEKVYDHMSQFDIAFIPFYINKITNAVSPVKLFEYWLAKKPVVCTKTTELAQFEGTALYANTSEALIKQLRMLKNNPARRKELAEKGYQLVKTKYNWDAMIKQYIKAL